MKCVLNRVNRIAGTSLWFLFALTAAAIGQPANDDFVNRALLSGSPLTVVSNNVSATAETGEPDHAGGEGATNSVWWSWTAPFSGNLEINTFGSDFDTDLAVYTGMVVNALGDAVAENDDDSSGGDGVQSKVDFVVASGTTYQIVVDGWGDEEGNVTLNILGGPVGPTNDNFANAISLVGLPVSGSGSNYSASVESGEPSHDPISSGGRSVWWSWVAPTTTTVSVDTFGSGFDTHLAIYTGTVVSALTQIAQNDSVGVINDQSELQFAAVQGVTYYIAVDGQSMSEGDIALNLSLIAQGSGNDNFIDSYTMVGFPVTVTGSNVAATAESGEPAHAGDPADESVWWDWTAPTDDDFLVTTLGSSFNTTLGVYTGAAVNALTTIAFNDDANTNDGFEVESSELILSASAGETYYFAVDGKGSAEGDITLNLSQLFPTPPNDFFVNRELITGLPASATGSNVLASSEANEPNHAGGPTFASVWWTWTAPSSGNVEIDTFGSNFDTRLGVYTGTEVTNLTEVAENGDFGDGLQSKVEFAAVAGTTYQIAVDGYDEAEGSVSLNIVAGPASPANDHFVDAFTLFGVSTSATGSNDYATAEVGEPDHEPPFAPERTVWWKWASPTNGIIELDTFGSDFDTVLAVYTGASVDALTLVAGNSDFDGGVDQSRVTFHAQVGITYYIAIDGEADFGSIDLNLGLIPTSSISAPTIQSGTEIHLQWTSTPGEVYEVLQSTDLSIWTTFTNISATSAVINVVAPVQEGEDKVFYHVGTRVDG